MNDYTMMFELTMWTCFAFFFLAVSADFFVGVLLGAIVGSYIRWRSKSKIVKSDYLEDPPKEKKIIKL